MGRMEELAASNRGTERFDAFSAMLAYGQRRRYVYFLIQLHKKK